MTIAVCNMQSQGTIVQCIMWKKLNKFMKKNGVGKPNFKASWRIVRRPTGMLSKLSMAIMTQRSPWRTKSSLASYIGLHCRNNTYGSTSSLTCKSNIVASASNIRKQKLWKRRNQDTFPFGPSDYLLELLWKMPFVNQTSG
jgi:hypothetical protein